MVSVFTSKTDGTAALCSAQDLKLNMMFTVGAVLTNVSALVIGRTLDSYGPRACGLVGCCFLFASCIIFINAKAISSFDPYLVGYGAMALGGPFTFISSFQLSNTFPKKSGTVLALLTGAFDASSAVFLMYKIVYNKTSGSVKIEDFFRLYLIVPAFILLAQLFVMPKDSYMTPPLTEDNVIEPPMPTEQSALINNQPSHQPATNRRSSLGDAVLTAYETDLQKEKKRANGIFGILHPYPASYQFKTWWFILMCLFATIQMLRLNYFVATIHSQYTFLLGSASKAEHLNKIFDIALPLGGLISVPFVGIFLDHCSTVVVLSGLLGISLLLGVLGVIPNAFGAGLFNVLFFVAYRPFFYTSISDYCAKVFGFQTFGTVYGSIMTISGLVNYCQTFLDHATHEKFNMNPTPLNLVLLAITVVIGFTTVIYVQVQGKKFHSRKIDVTID